MKHVNKSGFYDLENFTPKIELEKNAPAIIEEISKIPIESMFPWHEKDIYTGGWLLQPILLTDITFDKFLEPLSQTLSLLKSLKCIQAGVSVLIPNTTIQPHSDDIYDDVLLSSKTYRLQLGINIPEGCALTVDDIDQVAETQAWKNGQVLAFDSSRIHSAVNPSQSNRIVLIADFQKQDEQITTEELNRLKMYYLKLYGLVN